MSMFKFLKRLTIKGFIAVVFSILIAVAFLGSFWAMAYFKYKDPTADVSVWLNIFLAAFGYVVGILTGILGIPPVGGGLFRTESSRD